MKFIFLPCGQPPSLDSRPSGPCAPQGCEAVAAGVVLPARAAAAPVTSDRAAQTPFGNFESRIHPGILRVLRPVCSASQCGAELNLMSTLREGRISSVEKLLDIWRLRGFNCVLQILAFACLFVSFRVCGPQRPREYRYAHLIDFDRSQRAPAPRAVEAEMKACVQPAPVDPAVDVAGSWGMPSPGDSPKKPKVEHRGQLKRRSQRFNRPIHCSL